MDNTDFIIQNDSNKTILTAYTGLGREVVIPVGVTHIYRAFHPLESIEKVIIPEGVRVIGEWSFCGCKNLKRIVIPNTVIKIGFWAFKCCESLEEIILPEGLLIIENNAFDECTRLEKIVLPNSVMMLGKQAFARCTSLSSVIVGDGIREFGESVFSQCQCDIYISHWSRGFSKAVLDCPDICIHTQDKLSEIPARFRNIALRGFLTEKIGDQDPEKTSSYIDFVKRNVRKLSDFAFKNPSLLYYLCENKLIKAKDFDFYMEKAISCQDFELRDLLLDYQNNLSKKTLTRARSIKEKK